MQSWFVVKIETDKGIRLGINTETEKPLTGPLHFMDAARECRLKSEELKIPEYDHNEEVFLWEATT